MGCVKKRKSLMGIILIVYFVIFSRQTPQSTAHPHSTSHDSLPEVLMYGEALQQWYRDCFLPWSQGPLQDMSKYVREMTEICKQSPQGSGTH